MLTPCCETFAAIFRGMTCWNGEQIVVQADMPRDVDFTYTRANIIGKPPLFEQQQPGSVHQRPGFLV